MMQAGDVVLYRGTSLISRAISYITGCPYTHASMAISDTKIIEAERFVRTRIRTYDPTNAMLILKADLTPEQRLGISKYAQTLVGKRYGYLKVLRWFIRLVLRVDLEFLMDDANSLYCTELIDDCYAYLGIDLVPNRETGDVLPMDLWRSPVFSAQLL